MQSGRGNLRSRIRSNERLLWLIPAIDFLILVTMVLVPIGKKVEALPALSLQVQQAVGEFQQAVGGRQPDELIDFSGKKDLLAYGEQAIPHLVPLLEDEAQAAAAVDILASIGGNEARQSILAMLDGPPSKAPSNLAAALAHVGNRDTAQQLAARYRGGQGPWDEVILRSLRGMGKEGQKWIARLMTAQ